MKFGKLSITVAMAAACAMPVSAMARPCFTKAQIGNAVTAFLPAALGTLRSSCSPLLPESSAIAGITDAKLQLFKDAATEARPGAIGALRAMFADDIPAEASPEALLTMADAMIPVMLAGELKKDECVIADEFWSALSPLPPQNWGALAATFLEIGVNEDKKAGKKPEFGFDICPASEDG